MLVLLLPLALIAVQAGAQELVADPGVVAATVNFVEERRADARVH